MSNVKISQLTSGAPAQDGDELAIARAGQSLKVTRQELTLAEAQAAAAASAAAAAANANANVRAFIANVSASLPDPVTLNISREIGTYASPVAGNINVDLTDSVRGYNAMVVHSDATEPTITVSGGTARKFGSETYDTAGVNLILIFWLGGTDVAYMYAKQ